MILILCQQTSFLALHPHLPSSSHLHTKARMSAARPVPSHTMTGTGGESVTYSNTWRIVWGPPSITTQTTGVTRPPPAHKNINVWWRDRMIIFLVPNVLINNKIFVEQNMWSSCSIPVSTARVSGLNTNVQFMLFFIARSLVKCNEIILSDLESKNKNKINKYSITSTVLLRVKPVSSIAKNISSVPTSQVLSCCV